MPHVKEWGIRARAYKLGPLSDSYRQPDHARRPVIRTIGGRDQPLREALEGGVQVSEDDVGREIKLQGASSFPPRHKLDFFRRSCCSVSEIVNCDPDFIFSTQDRESATSSLHLPTLSSQFTISINPVAHPMSISEYSPTGHSLFLVRRPRVELHRAKHYRATYTTCFDRPNAEALLASDTACVDQTASGEEGYSDYYQKGKSNLF
jgi:hypothetical protein